MASSPLDFAVLAVYLVGVVAFGLWVGRDQKGAADYMLGDRNIAWWGLLFSIVATETGTVTFLSIPGFAWSRDFTFVQLPLGYLVGRFLVVAVLLPHYFSGEYFTAYEVLRKRFGGAVGQAASLLFMLTRSLADFARDEVRDLLRRLDELEVAAAGVCHAAQQLLVEALTLGEVDRHDRTRMLAPPRTTRKPPRPVKTATWSGGTFT